MAEYENTPFPRLRIEMTGIKENVQLAFMEKCDEIKEYTKNVIDLSFNELLQKGLQAKIILATKEAIDKAIIETVPGIIEEIIYDFFTKGEGSKILCKAIFSYLGDKQMGTDD